MKGRTKTRKRLIVVGGGAAGFFCAVNAARFCPLLDVTILEKTGKLLSKVKVSGGGRCNVTHACFDIGDMSARYPRGQHFLRKSFHRFFTTDTIAWFRERGVLLKEEPDGRMFPVSDSSQTIIDCLIREGSRYNVGIRIHTAVAALEQVPGGFVVTTAAGEQVSADMVCVATGGYPRSDLFDWLMRTGHTIETPVPSLFTFNLPRHPITRLMGVSQQNVAVKISGTRFEERGPVMITHWGLSGPAVLRLSARAARELAEKGWACTIHLNWVPGYNQESAKQKMLEQRTNSGSQAVGKHNPFGLAARLWIFLLEESGIPATTRWSDMAARVYNSLSNMLCDYQCRVQGKTTFKEEFVTAGGVRLSEIDPQTMMSRRARGLFFAGEVMDVDGITGGYNFQHAWTSGFIAASAIASDACTETDAMLP